MDELRPSVPVNVLILGNRQICQPFVSQISGQALFAIDQKTGGKNACYHLLYVEKVHSATQEYPSVESIDRDALAPTDVVFLVGNDFINENLEKALQHITAKMLCGKFAKLHIVLVADKFFDLTSARKVLDKVQCRDKFVRQLSFSSDYLMEVVGEHHEMLLKQKPAASVPANNSQNSVAKREQAASLSYADPAIFAPPAYVESAAGFPKASAPLSSEDAESLLTLAQLPPTDVGVKITAGFLTRDLYLMRGVSKAWKTWIDNIIKKRLGIDTSEIQNLPGLVQTAILWDLLNPKWILVNIPTITTPDYGDIPLGWDSLLYNAFFATPLGRAVLNRVGGVVVSNLLGAVIVIKYLSNPDHLNHFFIALLNGFITLNDVAIFRDSRFFVELLSPHGRIALREKRITVQQMHGLSLDDFFSERYSSIQQALFGFNVLYFGNWREIPSRAWQCMDSGTITIKQLAEVLRSDRDVEAQLDQLAGTAACLEQQSLAKELPAQPRPPVGGGAPPPQISVLIAQQGLLHTRKQQILGGTMVAAGLLGATAFLGAVMMGVITNGVIAGLIAILFLALFTWGLAKLSSNTCGSGNSQLNPLLAH